MNQCECYHLRTYKSVNGERDFLKHECWGTKERDECSCEGSRLRCDFYPEVRKKASEEVSSAQNRITKKTWEKIEQFLREYGLSYAATYDGDEKHIQISLIMKK